MLSENTDGRMIFPNMLILKEERTKRVKKICFIIGFFIV